MPWSPDILQRFGLGGEPMFALDFKDAPNPEVFDYRPERYILHTHGMSGGDHFAHVLENVTGPTQAVQIRSWYPSIGAIRATLSGTFHAMWIARAIPRGMLCRFKVGFAGMPYSEWADCGIYQFKGLSGARNNWVMEFGDYFSFLQSRPAIGTPADLFPDAGVEKQLASAYDPASSVGLRFGSTSDRETFTRDSGGNGLVYAAPSGSDPFYIKFSGESGSTLNVVDADVIDTTRVALSSGAKIRALGYVNGRPTDILEKLLFKTKTTATSVGTMPDDSNMMLSYDDHTVDRSDWRREAEFFKTFGDFNADFIAAQPLDNPWAAISDFFGAFGIWLVMRQGRLSFRFATDCSSTTAEELRTVGEITDVDIVGVEGQQLYHPDAREQLTTVIIRDGENTESDGKATTLPAQARFTHPVGEFIYGNSSNKADARDNLKRRILKWYTRIPMELSLTLTGWRWASLVPGDVVRVTSEYVPDLVGHFTFRDVPTIRDRVFMVTSIAPDFGNFTTSVKLAQLPDKYNPYQ